MIDCFVGENKPWESGVNAKLNGKSWLITEQLFGEKQHVWATLKREPVAINMTLLTYYFNSYRNAYVTNDSIPLMTIESNYAE